MFDVSNKYHSYSSKIGPVGSWNSLEYKIEKVLTKIDSYENISYIKITDVNVWKYSDSGLDVTVADKVEVELYSAK